MGTFKIGDIVRIKKVPNWGSRDDYIRWLNGKLTNLVITDIDPDHGDDPDCFVEGCEGTYVHLSDIEHQSIMTRRRGASNA